MKQFFIKKVLPHFLVLIGFWLFSLAYFPIDFSKKQVQQSDIIHYKGGSQEIEKYRKETGEQTLWTNTMFAGTPAVGISVNYPYISSYAYYILNPFQLKSHAYTLFLALTAFYFLMCVLGVSPLLAFIGAIGFGLSTYFFIIESVGHNSKSRAMALMPYIIGSILLIYRNNKWLLGGVLYALFFTLQNGVNHPQIVYYTGFIVLAIVLTYLWKAIQEKQFISYIKKSALILLFSSFALLTNFSNIVTQYTHGKQTIRGKSELTISPSGKPDNHAKENQTSGLDRDYINQYSYGLLETFDLYIPGLMGVSNGYDLGEDSHTYKYVQSKYGRQAAKQIAQQAPTYWGPQPFTEGPVYIGAVLIFLFILALVGIKGQTKIWVIGATAICFILAWGKHASIITDLFIDYFPLYNKFRTVSMILVIAELTIPLFGIYGLYKFLKQDKEQQLKALKISTIIAGGICLFFIVFAGSFDFTGLNDAAYVQRYNSFRLNGEELMDKIRLDREALMRGDAFRSLLFVVLSAASILALIKLPKLKKEYLFVALGILIVADLWPMAKSHLNEDNFKDRKTVIEKPFQVNQYDVQILQSELSNPKVRAKVEEAYGKPITKIKTSDEFIQLLQEVTYHTNYKVLNLTKGVMSDASTSYLHKSLGGYSAVKLRKYQELWDFHISQNNPAVINMLNTKYVITAGKDGKAQVIKNPGALGNAWFVNEVKYMKNADEEIMALNSFEPSKTAIANIRDKSEMGTNFTTDATAKVEMMEYLPNNLKYKSSSNADGLVVFSEIYYKNGWKAFVDGKETKVFNVNYLLRAIKVPAGEHKIELKFDMDSYSKGNIVSIVFSILMLLVVALGVGFEVYKFYKKTNKELE